MVEWVEIPLLEEAGTIVQLIMLPEAAEVHLPWLRTRLADYGDDVRARLLAGLFLPVDRARHRAFVRAAGSATSSTRVFERVDLLAAPEMPIVAPPIGQDEVEVRGERMPYRMSR